MFSLCDINLWYYRWGNSKVIIRKSLMPTICSNPISHFLNFKHTAFALLPTTRKWDMNWLRIIFLLLPKGLKTTQHYIIGIQWKYCVLLIRQLFWLRLLVQKQLHCKLLLYMLSFKSPCCLFAILVPRCAKQQLCRLYKFEHNLLPDKGLKTICFQFYHLGADWALLSMPCLKPVWWKYTVYGAHFITWMSHSHTLINLFHHFSVLQ